MQHVAGYMYVLKLMHIFTVLEIWISLIIHLIKRKQNFRIPLMREKHSTETIVEWNLREIWPDKYVSVNRTLFGTDPCPYLLQTSFYINLQKTFLSVLRVSKNFVFLLWSLYEYLTRLEKDSFFLTDPDPDHWYSCILLCIGHQDMTFFHSLNAHTVSKTFYATWSWSINVP